MANFQKIPETRKCMIFGIQDLTMSSWIFLSYHVVCEKMQLSRSNLIFSITLWTELCLSELICALLAASKSAVSKFKCTILFQIFLSIAFHCSTVQTTPCNWIIMSNYENYLTALMDWGTREQHLLSSHVLNAFFPKLA